MQVVCYIFSTSRLAIWLMLIYLSRYLDQETFGLRVKFLPVTTSLTTQGRGKQR